ARGRGRLRRRTGAGALPLLRRLREGADGGRRPGGQRRGRGEPAEGRAESHHRRRGALGPVGQLAQELEHPHARGPGAVPRGRPAEGEERGGEGAGRDRGAAATRGTELRHEARRGGGRAAGGGSRDAAPGAADRGRRGGVVRHRAKSRQLSRTASHRKALLANLATSLFQHDRIVTTEAKAKELRPYAERLITLARRGGLHARRL